LRVAFTAGGDAVSYHWSFGDGAATDGPVVEHVYGAGAFTAQLTATGSTGETVTKAIRVLSFALSLRSKSVVTYRRHLRFQGHLVPAVRGMRVGVFAETGGRVASGLTRRNGRFRIGAPITKPGVYTARFGAAASNAISVRVRPLLSARFVGSGAVGRPLRLMLRLRPAVAGPVTVEIRRNGKRLGVGRYGDRASIRLPSRRAAGYRIIARTEAAAGYAAARVSLRKTVFFPRLSLGARGPSVLALNQGLHRLHIALGAVDSTFGLDTRDAVVAFQKLHDLPRTGAVDGRLWRYLAASGTPRARYPHGDHIEVSKPLQVLFVVRGGRVVLVSHVSTGATGNTPVGRWHVYSKTPGWLASGMFDSSFFLRGFAIHGYPSVPFYPASHGCVRLPVWLAPRIYGLAPYGSAIYIY
jgi:L,D-transpeptidase catalytic domain/PKD domain/Putative peptidoglycan binding domain